MDALDAALAAPAVPQSSSEKLLALLECGTLYGVEQIKPMNYSCDVEHHAGPLPWLEAEQDCVERGGHLASIHNDEQLAIIILAIGGAYAFIGLNDREWEMGCDGSYSEHNAEAKLAFEMKTGNAGPNAAAAVCVPPTATCARDKEPEPVGWVWSDQSLGDYTNWATGHPTSWSRAAGSADCQAESSVEDCVHLRPWGEWNDASCAPFMSYVCGYACNDGDAALQAAGATIQAGDAPCLLACFLACLLPLLPSLPFQLPSLPSLPSLPFLPFLPSCGRKACGLAH
jgi:hypothetical protein